ncbi:MAG: hypothetical protein GY795_23255 [Desulfobacterales bacterium]|nr:hypothetical protein [Desulfobacterales bacterium]
MNMSAREILHSFDRLPDKEKQEAAFEIIRRTAKFKLPDLKDEDFVYCAEELFLKLDREESENG